MKFMVFDVESIGLHGEGFAVGWVIVDETGREYEALDHGCDPELALGSLGDRAWVAEHVRAPLDCSSVRAVRDAFWTRWEDARADGITLVSDCLWPVEARFLEACIADDEARAGQGPYPLIDVASVLLAAGRDPVGTYERMPAEYPPHNPLTDARQSARILIETMQMIRGKRPVPA